ncbi:MAG: helix-turn-helix domain-containing protein [Planctomycetota bacterium]
MARQSRFVLLRSPSERRELWHRVRSTTAPTARVRRAQVILRFADGVPVAQVARALEMQRHDGRKWIKGFIKHRVRGLEELPRPPPSAGFHPRGSRSRSSRSRASDLSCAVARSPPETAWRSRVSRFAPGSSPPSTRRPVGASSCTTSSSPGGCTCG